MKKKFMAICLIVVLAVTALGLSSASRISPINNVVKRVQSLAMFSGPKWSAHLRTPNIEQIGSLLEEQGIPLNDPAARDAAIQAFETEWAKHNPTTSNPQKLQQLLARERSGMGPLAADATTPQIMSLAVPMEFPNSDTFDWCGSTVTTTGPLHNQIPAPGPRDNNTLWYDDTTPALYNELYFGVGPNAGVIVHHPNLGTLDFRGSTMANYLPGAVRWPVPAQGRGLSQVAAGLTLGGLVRRRILAPAASLLGSPRTWCEKSVDAVNADNPTFAWETYDGDGDGIVDNFTVLHAGMGQEGGGGAQGEFSIWSHASAID